MTVTWSTRALCSSLLLEVQPAEGEPSAVRVRAVSPPLQGGRGAGMTILAYGDACCRLRGAPNSVRNSPSFLHLLLVLLVQLAAPVGLGALSFDRLSVGWENNGFELQQAGRSRLCFLFSEWASSPNIRLTFSYFNT